MYKNIVYFNNLFTEIAKRLKLKKMNDIFFLLPLEIIDLLRSNKKANQDIIEERQKGFLLFSTGQRTDVFSGAIVDQAKKKINFLEPGLSISSASIANICLISVEDVLYNWSNSIINFLISVWRDGSIVCNNSKNAR